MIRVLNIISDTNIGGAGRVLLNYLRYTDRGRFETLVALPRGSLLGPVLEEAGGHVKLAILLEKSGLEAAKAKALLDRHGGHLAQAIENAREEH